MTNEELVAKIQGGERERLEELWTQVERFVIRQAKRVSGEREDMCQAGYIGLVSAVDSYDPTRGMTFISWLAVHLKSAFADAGGWRRRTQDPLVGAYSLDAPLSEDGGTLEDIIPDPVHSFAETENRIWQEQLRAALDTAMSGLTEEQEGTLRRRYYQGMTLEATGTDMGVSAAEAKKQEKKALSVLRRPQLTKQLRQFIEESTNYFLHVGVSRFQSTGSSAVEALAIRREEMAGL